MSSTYNVHIGASKSLKPKEPLPLLALVSHFLLSTLWGNSDGQHDFWDMDLGFPEGPDFLSTLWTSARWQPVGGAGVGKEE